MSAELSWQEQERFCELTHGTLIHIFRTVTAFVALWAGANILSIQRVGVAQRPLVAGVADARIIQMT